MRVYETQLPGVGVRYTMRFDSGRELLVLTHNDRTKEVFWRDDTDADAEQLFEVDRTDAKKISDIFAGSYFHPVDEGLEDVLENARLRWIQIDAGSPLAGQTIGEAGIRSRTGVTILGVRRDGRMIADIDARTTIDPNDVLVAVGSDDAHEAFQALLSSS